MGISYTSSSAEAMKNFQDIRSKDIRLSQEVQRALANSKYGRQQSAPALIPIADDHQIRDKLEYLKSRKIKGARS